MRLVIQRVKRAKCTVDEKITGQIDNGFMILVGIKESDTLDIVEKMADKVSKLRIFEDDEGKMNLDLKKVDGGILSISQFTLYGDCRKGNRPSFTEAKEPKAASEFYECFNDLLKAKGFKVEKGIFGAHMEIELLNDGPVTIILDSEK